MENYRNFYSEYGVHTINEMDEEIFEFIDGLKYNGPFRSINTYSSASNLEEATNEIMEDIDDHNENTIAIGKELIYQNLMLLRRIENISERLTKLENISEKQYTFEDIHVRLDQIENKINYLLDNR